MYYWKNLKTSIDIIAKGVKAVSKNYYFVGLYGKDKSMCAYLLDGKTGEVLATKTQ